MHAAAPILPTHRLSLGPSRRAACAALGLWLGASPLRQAVAQEAQVTDALWPDNAAPLALQLARWAIGTQDHQRMPFAIVDKPSACVHVFSAQAIWLGSAPVLLGAAYGDTSVPGIGERPLSQIRPEERTTPAGRFPSEPGRNTRGDDLVWVDYDSALSMHRVRSVHPGERRLQRLASPRPAERRISNGCVNVPHAFYDRAIAPTLGSTPGVVYVLPDMLPFASVFIAASAYP